MFKKKKEKNEESKVIEEETFLSAKEKEFKKEKKGFLKRKNRKDTKQEQNNELKEDKVIFEDFDEEVVQDEPKKDGKKEVEKVIERDLELNPIKGVRFWLFLLACALLLVVGLWIIFDKTMGTKISLGFTGVAILLFGLIRIVPLVKSVKSTKAKWVSLLEIFVDLLIGGAVFAVAILFEKNGESNLTKFVNNNYKYILGIVFYLKAVFYFVNTSLLKEETTKFEFWVHILVISVACLIFALNFDATKLGYVIAALCLLCALFLGYESGSNYFNYRKKNPKLKENKKHKNKEKENKIILPKNENDENNIYLS